MKIPPRLRTHEPSPSAKMICHLEDDPVILRGTFLVQFFLLLSLTGFSTHAHGAAVRCCSWSRCARPRATSWPRSKIRSPLARYVPSGRRRPVIFSAAACRSGHGAVEPLGCRCSKDGGPAAASLHQVAAAAVAGLLWRCTRRANRAVRDRAPLLADGSARGGSW